MFASSVSLKAGYACMWFMLSLPLLHQYQFITSVFYSGFGMEEEVV